MDVVAQAKHSAVKHSATLTIILITIVYIVCNLPLFVNSIIWVHELVSNTAPPQSYYNK